MTIRGLAELQPRTLSLMHGPAYIGDCPQALRDLATPMTSDYSPRASGCSAPACSPGRRAVR
jgi:hypothetical protein